MTPNNLRYSMLATIGFMLLFSGACKTKAVISSFEDDVNRPHIVFISGDEEYRSEESLPMLARILQRELGAKVTICYSLDDEGFIDPNRSDHIPGLEALETADLMVIFARFRALPDNQLRHITKYVDSGKPVVGFRTSTHAFLYKDEKAKTRGHMNNEWPTRVFGQQWITHHGHFDDGANPLTHVDILPEAANHPILLGVESFEAYSWLYHVQGGGWSVYGDKSFLLEGRSLKSGHEMEGRLHLYPKVQPIAWTKTYHGARVFFTTLGHPYDFLNDNMRRLSLNGIYWALSREVDIPAKGVNTQIVGEYAPNNSGFGQKYKLGVRAGN